MEDRLRLGEGEGEKGSGKRETGGGGKNASKEVRANTEKGKKRGSQGKMDEENGAKGKKWR